MPVTCGSSLQIRALPGVPLVQPGDDLAALAIQALERAGMGMESGDVLVLSSKLVSRAEGCFVDLGAIEPGPRARDLAATVAMDPRHVELILSESIAVSRAVPNVLIVRHRLGFVSANAGIDMSNAEPDSATPGSGPWALRLPRDPDATAERMRSALHDRFGVALGVIVSDSFGRPFRLGTVGTAIGVAGVPALNDLRGQPDLCGRTLEVTVTGLADQIAAAADLVAGQGAEGRGVVLVRGLEFEPNASSAKQLLRAPEEDLYA